MHGSCLASLNSSRTRLKQHAQPGIASACDALTCAHCPLNPKAACKACSMCCAAQQAEEPGLDSTPQQSLQPGQAQLLPDGSCLSPGAMRAQNQEPSRQFLEAERAMDTYLAAVRLLPPILHLRPKL